MSADSPIRSSDVSISIEPNCRTDWPDLRDQQGQPVTFNGNHHFEPLERFDRKTARSVIAIESQQLAAIESGATNFSDIRDLEEKAIEDDPDLSFEQPWLWFDLGVRAAAVALSTNGANPVASCNGGCFRDDTGCPHAEQSPRISFQASLEQLAEIRDAAARAGCGIYSTEESLVLYAGHPSDLVSFADFLLGPGET